MAKYRVEIDVETKGENATAEDVLIAVVAACDEIPEYLIGFELLSVFPVDAREILGERAKR